MSDISAVIKKMIDYSNGEIHDINHFLKVYAFAKTIGEEENLDSKTQKCLEVSAVVHDIACPLCREKYGNTNGKYQEKEGKLLAKEFLEEFNFEDEFVKRVCFIVSHHHTYTGVDKMDYQIMLEADFLVNADEGRCSKEAIKEMLEKVYKTKTGKELLKSVYKRILKE